jgi:hypothetical protein
MVQYLQGVSVKQYLLKQRVSITLRIDNQVSPKVKLDEKLQN